MGISAEVLRPGVVRLLEKEPTKAERYAHAAALLAILERRPATKSGGASLHKPR